MSSRWARAAWTLRKPTAATAPSTISAGNSCTLDVTFTPQAAGLRMGAVQLVDNLGNLLKTSQIYGNGEGPEIVFRPIDQRHYDSQWPLTLERAEHSGLHAKPPRNDDGYVRQLIYCRPEQRAPAEARRERHDGYCGGARCPAGCGNRWSGQSSLSRTPVCGRWWRFRPGASVSACQIPVYSPPSADPVAVVMDGLGDLFIADPSARRSSGGSGRLCKRQLLYSHWQRMAQCKHAGGRCRWRSLHTGQQRGNSLGDGRRMYYEQLPGSGWRRMGCSARRGRGCGRGCLRVGYRSGRPEPDR